MDRALPSVNRFLTKKDRDRNRRIHRQKLRTIKSSIDNNAPKGFKTNRTRKNPKKERMMEENFQKIERENRLLLRKMSSIMQGKDVIDNRTDNEKYAKSLNRSLRKRQLKRITFQNANILKRIEHCQPTFSVENWERDYKKSKEIVYNISEYKTNLLGSPGGGGLRSVNSMRPSSSMGFYKSIHRTGAGKVRFV